MLTLPFTLLALVLLATTSTSQAQSQSSTVTAAQKNFPEFLDLLRLPNVPADPADMQRNATFLVDIFRKHGFEPNYWTTPRAARSSSPHSASHAKAPAPSSSTSISMVSR